MGKSKKVAVTEPEEVNVSQSQEGDIDPYASGVSIPNPEPNNGKSDDPEEEFNQQGQAAPADVPNSDADEQDEVAEGRTEEESPAEAEGSGEEEPTEEDPLAAEANEKAV